MHAECTKKQHVSVCSPAKLHMAGLLCFLFRLKLHLNQRWDILEAE